MPKVRVPRKNVTPGEIVTVLSRRLGPGYQVESNGGRRVMVRKSPLMYASISISDQPGASVFGVHGGGFLFLRLVNTFGTARRVADALRRSPEFRSLRAFLCINGPAACSVKESAHGGKHGHSCRQGSVRGDRHGAGGGDGAARQAP